jgi:DNA primase
MKQIPDSFVEELRRRVDIVEVVSDYVQLRRAGRSFTGLCPFHNERTPSFSVSPDRQMFHCFGCGAGGTVIRFVMDMEGQSFVEAVARLAARVNLDLPFELQAQSDSGPHQSRLERMKEAHELATKLYNYILMNTAAGVQALTYLEMRGLSRQTMMDFRLGYAPESGTTLASFLRRRGFEDELLADAGLTVTMGIKVVDRFRHRVMIPIADAQGHVVSFGGRSLQADGHPKYLNSPETPIFHKGNMLFNLHLARKDIRKDRTGVLFEGYMDAISAHQAGVKNVVASMGTSLTSDHVNLLKRFADKVIIAYDGDAAGIRATKRAIDMVHDAGMVVRVATFPDGQDPDDFIRNKGATAFGRQVLTNALSELQFLLHELRSRANLESPAARTDFLRQSLALLGQRSTPIEQEEVLRNLSQEFQVSMDTLKEELTLVSKQGNQRHRPPQHFKADHGTVISVTLPKGHVKAGNLILQAMLTDSESYQFALNRGVDELVLPEQTALLALLYHFKSSHPNGDAGAFMDSLDDPQLISMTSALLMEEPPHYNVQVLEDCLRTIRLHHLERAYENALKQSMNALVEGRLEDAARFKQESDEYQTEIATVRGRRESGDRA